MFVLAIDPGLTRTGYALLQSATGRSTTPALRSVGVIRTPADDVLAGRLREIYNDLTAIIAEWQPDEMAIETVFVNQNLSSAMGVARASGVAILAAAHANIPVTEYTPTAIKAAVAGYGAADKRQVQEMVMRRLNLRSAPQPADASDAVAVGLCHMQALRLTVQQRSVS